MKRIYEILADLIEYPLSDSPLLVEECRALLKSKSDSRSSIGSFALFTTISEGFSLSERQEIYTRTFDLNPVCALEVGYHLFGENYKRGEFLANLRRTEEPFALGQEHQLPDYLPVLLRLLTRLDDEELRTALISECMIPALDRMLKSLGDSENAYRHLLAAINELLRTEAGVCPGRTEPVYLPVVQDSAFRPGRSKELF